MHQQTNLNKDKKYYISTCVFYTILTLIIIKLLMFINPCRLSLTEKEYNIISIFLLFVTYYSTKYFINSNYKYNYIEKKYEKYNKYYNVLLLIIYFFLILNQI